MIDACSRALSRRGAVRFIALAVTALSNPLLVQAAPPTLSHLFPAGGQRGTKVAVTCSGKFDWPVKVFSPGIEVAVGAESGKLELTIPADLPTDRIWVRLYNAEGGSAAVPFLIGQLPEVAEKEPNNTLKSPQPIDSPRVTVNGALAGADVDAYAVNLPAGQTLVAALDANTRLGSPMDAVLQVVGPDGFVVAENHDDLVLDPRLAYRAEKGGVYVVRLFAFPAAPDSTIAFRGGDNYVYRLTLTTGPYITHAVPLATTSSQPAEVELRGWNVPSGTRAPVTVLGGGRVVGSQEFELFDELRKLSEARIGWAFRPEAAGSARVRINPLPRSLIAETAANNQPTSLPLDSSVTGCLKQSGQSDVYRLPLKKGEQVIISLESFGFDLPMDPVLTIADPNGAAVAENDDVGASHDAVIALTAALEGEYRLTVSDRYNHGSDRHLYLLTARSEVSDFELSMVADALVVPADKPAELVVKVVRRNSPAGAVGPITIQPRDLPAGVTAPAVVSEPTGPTAQEVKLLFTSTAGGFSGPLQIVGKAQMSREIERTARTPAKLGVAFDSLWLTAIAKP